jgi:hypothetical protein
MLENIVPPHIDNAFRGRRLAVWLFALILLMKTAQSVAVLVGGASVLMGADGIPLDTYTPSAAQTVVSLWALLGLTRLLICLLGLLVLVRYRSMLPFMFGFLVLLDAGRHIVLQYLPIARVGTPPGPIVNSMLMALTIAGLVLSLLPRRTALVQSAEQSNA